MPSKNMSIDELLREFGVFKVSKQGSTLILLKKGVTRRPQDLGNRGNQVSNMTSDVQSSFEELSSEQLLPGTVVLSRQFWNKGYRVPCERILGLQGLGNFEFQWYCVRDSGL